MILRTAEGWWVERSDGAVHIATSARTTGELIIDTEAIKGAVQCHEKAVPVSELALRSPVTAPCRVVAQMVNYRSHAKDSGFDPDKVLPTFFRKASGSISSATDPIRPPGHVQFLDYEVELGLVFGATLSVGDQVEEADIPRLIAGLVITNDISARDVQLTKTQFYEAKSYPGFTPTGPRLVLLDPEDFRYLYKNLQLTLSVNGVIRQDSSIADMIFGPLAALKELSRFQQMDAGDMLLTGTPGGTALKAPPALIGKIAALLPPAKKWRAFFKAQARNPRYLHAGDVVTTQIRSLDGHIDLGVQCNVVGEARS